MLWRILTAGLIGGVAGGLLLAALQAFTTVPLILHAELFEVAAEGAAHTHAAEGGDALRFGLTMVATIAVATGYAWMLLAAMFAHGSDISARSVLPWAVAAFFATGLAPAFGLGPQLPGAGEADLLARQAWWLLTATATAAGLAAIFLGGTARWIGLGLVLIALPHVIGAPQPEVLESDVPAEIAARFAGVSLGMQALTWIVPAALAGFAFSRLDGAEAAVEAGSSSA